MPKERYALPLARARFVAAVPILLLISGMTFNTPPTSAQIPAIPSLPTGDGTITPDSQSTQPPTVIQAPPATIPPPTIQITSLQDGQQVPAGELTIDGISSDDEESDCQVYADVNDITPMRNVTAAGDSPQEIDFSKWTFTYSQLYQLIKQGENELTAKISCFAPDNPTPLSEWHTVNVTGLAAGQPVPGPTEEEAATNIGEGEEEEEEEEEEEGFSLFGE